jgi:energy-coupling factor transporter ATP-binding protein EcfA2
VKQGWIEGVLEKSLFRATMIDLGMEATGSDVENPWTTTVERPAARSEPLSQQKTIADVFDEEGGSLLILGAPGSGKTTSLLGLARTLIARAERDPNLPVPVVFPLSSWTESRDALVRWMASELAAKYQVPRKIGQARLESGRILPLLDGLDEQVADTRAACVSAINEYVLQTGLTGVVVCCGLKEYTGLPNRLALNAAVRLRELRDDQVQDYLTAGGDELGGLRVALQRDSALRIDARLPLMLNLMIQAYWGLSTADIEREGEESAAARRRNLMGAYAREMFRRASLGRMN